MQQDRLMVYDFKQTIKSYDKDSYRREHFISTPCPACPAVGRYKMHGSYTRYVIYIEEEETVCERLAIKRIKCASCGTTHAVMPGDIVPYLALSLFVVAFILMSYYVSRSPVLKVAEKLGFSFQYIYSVIYAFHIHKNRISQHFKETSPGSVSEVMGAVGILSLIKKPYLKFQCVYISAQRRPCFMCKYFDGIGAPPVGIHVPFTVAT